MQRAARSAPTNRYVCLAAPRVCVTRRRGPQFLGAGEPARVPCPPPGSLAAAPTRPAGHVAARHFVWRGRRGCLITRGGRSMRTGGGVGLPGRRPLPAIHTPCSASRASTRCGLRVPARSGARTGGSPPSRAPRDPARRPGDPAQPRALFRALRGSCFGRVPGTPSRASPLRLWRRKGEKLP